MYTVFLSLLPPSLSWKTEIFFPLTRNGGNVWSIEHQKKKNYNLNYNFLLRIKMLMCIVQDQRIYQVLSYIILKLGSLSSVMD